MTKADIINSIAQKTGVAKVDVLVTVEAFFKEIKESLARGEAAHVRGFGSFMLKKRAAKVARNIRENTAVHIPEHMIPYFKPSVEFTALVKDVKASGDDRDDQGE